MDAKQKRTILILSVLLFTGGLAWLFFYYLPRRRTSQDPSKFIESNSILWIGCNDNFPIKMGSCGPRVEALQHYFNKKADEAGITEAKLGDITASVPISTDGKFGQKTAALATRIVTNVSWWNNGMSEEVYAAFSQYFSDPTQQHFLTTT